MPDDLGERTEQATPRRLRQARLDGQVARSHDLGAGIALLLGTLATWFAASIVFGWKYADLVPPNARKYYGWALFPYLVFALWSGLQSEGVDNWGHVGGLIGGAVVVTLLHPELMERYREHNRRMRRLIGGTMLLLALAIATNRRPASKVAWTTRCGGEVSNVREAATSTARSRTEFDSQTFMPQPPAISAAYM